LEVDEALDDIQEPKQDTMGEWIITLLASYLDEEKPEAKTPTIPQEIVESPFGEQVAREAKDTTQKEESQQAEAPAIPQETTESTPQEHSAKSQQTQTEESGHFANPPSPLHELVLLVEPTRGTLDETIVKREEKKELEPESPTITYESIGGTLVE